MAANDVAPLDNFNPTQGGDCMDNGSPLYWFQTTSNSINSVCQPLLWKDATGSTPVNGDHPVLYNGLMNTLTEVLPTYASGTKSVTRLRFTGRFNSFSESSRWGWVHFYLAINAGRFGDGITPATGTNWLIYGDKMLYVKSAGANFSSIVDSRAFFTLYSYDNFL